MRRKATFIAAAVVALGALGLGGAAIANATMGDDGAPLTGAKLDRASSAALKAAGGGRVTETEHESEEGASYEVEITKADGSQLEVLLDESFNVVAVEADRDEPGDTEEPGDSESGQ
jgi:hypothetical protein